MLPLLRLPLLVLVAVVALLLFAPHAEAHGFRTFSVGCSCAAPAPSFAPGCYAPQAQRFTVPRTTYVPQTTFVPRTTLVPRTVYETIEVQSAPVYSAPACAPVSYDAPCGTSFGLRLRDRFRQRGHGHGGGGEGVFFAPGGAGVNVNVFNENRNRGLLGRLFDRR